MSTGVLEPLTPERRRRQTREHLLAAAAQVFAARGFHGATLDEVAKAAGFTKGAVYSNFASKDDLFLVLIEWHYARSMDMLRVTLESSEIPPEARLSDFVALLREQITQTPDSWAILYEEFRVYAIRNQKARRKLLALDEDAARTIAGIISAGRKRMGIHMPERPLDVARVILALDRGIGATRAIYPKGVNDTFLQTVMSLLARALGAAP